MAFPDYVKYSGLALSVLGAFAGGVRLYSRVVSWATNLKDNHLSTIESNSFKLLDRTEEQTKVLIKICTILEERRD